MSMGNFFRESTIACGCMLVYALFVRLYCQGIPGKIFQTGIFGLERLKTWANWLKETTNADTKDCIGVVPQSKKDFPAPGHPSGAGKSCGEGVWRGCGNNPLRNHAFEQFLGIGIAWIKSQNGFKMCPGFIHAPQ